MPNPHHTPSPADPDPAEPLIRDILSAYGGLVADFRQRWIAAHGIELPEREASRCPFCGRDCRDQDEDGYYRDCPHLLADLFCDWYDFSPSGTCRGAFERVAPDGLGPLNEAVSAFLRACKMVPARIEALSPARLRPLVQGVAAGAEIEDGRVEQNIQADAAAYGGYILAVCEEVGVKAVRGRYDTGDPYGTCPDVFWVEGRADEAARHLAGVVREDMKRLRKACRTICGRRRSGTRGTDG